MSRGYMSGGGGVIKLSQLVYLVDVILFYNRMSGQSQ